MQYYDRGNSHFLSFLYNFTCAQLDEWASKPCEKRDLRNCEPNYTSSYESTHEVANALFAASRFVMWSWFTSDKHCGNSARRILQNSASSFGVRTQVHRKFGEVCCHFLRDRELSVLNGYRDHETDIDICRPLFSLLFIECKLWTNYWRFSDRVKAVSRSDLTQNTF